MSDNRCSHDKCIFDKHDGYEECILHSDKKEMSSLYNPYFTEPEKFYEHLINYIVKYVFDLREESHYFNKETLDDYLRGAQLENAREIATNLKEIKIVFTQFSFPNTDEREFYRYELVLNKLGSIHFNYCTFYVSSLPIEHVECYFQDCEFYVDWTLLNYKPWQESDDLELYNNCVFHENVGSHGRTEEVFTLDYVQFYDCEFHKTLYFEDTVVKKQVFKNWKDFESIIDHFKILNSIFEDRFVLNNYDIREVSFNNSLFKNKFEFMRNNIEIFEVDDSNFDELAEFYKTSFSKFSMHKSIFSDYTGFEKCEFGKDQNEEKDYIANFQYITFLSFINFRKTKFYSGLLFEDTNLKESPNFLNSRIRFTNTSRETFRIIKHSFDKLGNHIEANKYYSLEMRKYKEELSNKNGSRQEKFIFWVNGLASNYGQSYWKAIKWLLLASFIYMIIVCGFNCNVFKTNLLLDFLNGWSKAILPFGRLLPRNLEFYTLIFTIVQSALIWHIVVALKRHTKR